MNKLTGQFIILCSAIFLIYWTTAAFTVKRAVEKENQWPRFLMFVVIIATFALLMRGRMPSTYLGKVLWPQTVTTGIVADAVTLAGLVTALWARAALGGNWSANPTFKENHELIEHGPYRYVRHPIYSGVLVMVFGTAIISGRVSSFVLLAVFFIGFWFRSRQEERLLTKHFPAAYPSYKARVKAFIPFVY
jgi:protein-S-isoprenylcysteine O-methyltransferase Ste14